MASFASCRQAQKRYTASPSGGRRGQDPARRLQRPTEWELNPERSGNEGSSSEERRKKIAEDRKVYLSAQMRRHSKKTGYDRDCVNPKMRLTKNLSRGSKDLQEKATVALLASYKS